MILTGEKGSGKSSIGAAIARHQAIRRAYADGVAYVCFETSSAKSTQQANESADAAEERSKGELVAALRRSICAELAIADEPGALVGALRERETLLILDLSIAAAHSIDGNLCGGAASDEAVAESDAGSEKAAGRAFTGHHSFGAMLHDLLANTLHLRLLIISSAPLPTHVSLPVKVVTQELHGLSSVDAARLVARRVGRPLQELLPERSAVSLETLALEPLLISAKGIPAQLVRCAATINEVIRTRGFAAHEAISFLSAPQLAVTSSTAHP